MPVNGARLDPRLVARARAATRRTTRGGVALTLVTLGMATVCFNKVRLGDWAISDLIFLLAVGVACVQLLVGNAHGLAPNAMRKTSPAILVGTLLIVLAGTASSFRSFEPMQSVAQIVRIIWITLPWFWLLRTVSPNWQTFARVRFGVAATVYVSCAGAIAGYLGLVTLTDFNLEGREAAFFSHPNELGGLMAMALPLVVMGSLQVRRRRHQGLRTAVAIGAIGFALNTTGSITALIAAATGLLAAWLLNLLTRDRSLLRRVRNPLPLILGALVAMMAVVWAVSSDLPAVERFTEFGQEGSGLSSSVDTRSSLNSEVIENLDRSLVTGVGFDSQVMLEAGVSKHRVHNLYLRLVYEAGIWSLLGLLAIIVTVVRQAWMLAVNTRGTPAHRIVVGLFGALVAMLVFALFQPLLAQRYFWIPIALIGVIWSLRRQEIQEQAEGLGPATDGPGDGPRDVASSPA